MNQSSQVSTKNITDGIHAKSLDTPKLQVHPFNMKPSRSERAIGRQTAAHISNIAKENKKANLRRELVLLQVTADLRFHGQVIIESREDAILTATNTRNSGPGDEPWQLVFFVDGSRFTNIKDKRKRKAPQSGKASGAAVVYQRLDQEWEERTFCLAYGLKSKITKMAAIAEALAIALSQILLLSKCQDENKAKVVIFADCQAAIHHVNKFQRTSPSEGRVHNDPIVRKLVTRSQYLRILGVEVEIRWVPGHSGVEGNVRADAAARSAAWRYPGIAEGVYLDEGLRIIELELAGGEG